ncbi:hypothetical protein EI983_05635 [Roseovarius faecimaris]|uniref:Serine aminopeptidase S33 domain-containing protein n=1 Tax=Roseovarius faecimaris TaxID=2494550 RepID=A0A6I6IRA8_9RHOB|nr:alpha/beta fold hydrolase [Roseovarius faecimaris]QGX97786.1 hypothetical protein EI983_05635 [Roseovarius faecimaris]
MARRLITFLALVAALGGAGFLGLGRFERAMVYPFDKSRTYPETIGLDSVREVLFDSLGQTLVLWVSPPEPGKPVILYFHGNAGNLANRAHRFAAFLDRGYGLIAPAYRGSSGSTGKPSERAITRDTRAIWRNVDSLISGIGATDIVIYGESLGAAVTLKMLDAPDTPRPRAVVLEAPFRTLADVVRHTAPQFEPLIPQMKNVWNSQAHARALTAPLLILHGTEDALIPIEQGRAIHDAARSSPKTFQAIRGAGHNNVWEMGDLSALWRFVEAD